MSTRGDYPMKNKSQILISRVHVISFVLFAATAVFSGCASNPPAPKIDPTGHVTGIALPADCGPVQLKITMSQDAPLTPSGTGAHSEAVGKVSNGTLQMPDLSGFDFSKEVKIDVQ